MTFCDCSANSLVELRIKTWGFLRDKSIYWKEPTAKTHVLPVPADYHISIF